MSVSQREERESYWERMFVFLTQTSYSFTVLLVQLHHLSPPLFLSLASASVLWPSCCLGLWVLDLVTWRKRSICSFVCTVMVKDTSVVPASGVQLHGAEPSSTLSRYDWEFGESDDLIVPWRPEKSWNKNVLVQLLFQWKFSKTLLLEAQIHKERKEWRERWF